MMHHDMVAEAQGAIASGEWAIENTFSLAARATAQLREEIVALDQCASDVSEEPWSGLAHAERALRLLVVLSAVAEGHDDAFGEANGWAGHFRSSTDLPILSVRNRLPRDTYSGNAVVDAWITESIARCAEPLGGRAFLNHIASRLADLDEFRISVGHRGDSLKVVLRLDGGPEARPDLEIIWADETVPNGVSHPMNR